MLLRLFKYSLTNIMRNSFLSFSSVLVLTLLMFFINILFLLHDVSFRIIDGVNDKLTISLYLEEGYNKNSGEVIGLLGEIGQGFPNIEAIYKTKEQVLDEIREQDPNLVKILERQNPLPETISLNNIALEQFSQLNTIIQSKQDILAQSQEWDKDFFSSYNAQYNRINSVIGTLQILQVGLYIMIGIFLFSIAIIIYSIIGNFIYYYRDEIYITRLVGGSKLFIYGPFGIQGAIYSVVAYSVSVILFFFLLKSIDAVLPAGLSDSGVIQNFATIFLIQLCISGLIWWMSGFVSSRKYLK